MFNFSEMTLKVGVREPNQSSFVGIRPSKDNSGFEFCLPHGFEDFKNKYDKNFDKVRDFFFLMYRTLRKFEQDNLETGRFKTKDSNNKKSQDKTIISKAGSILDIDEVEEDNQCILYSKISMIEKVLEAYDDLAIDSLQKKIRRTEEIDYSQIHRYLDRAIYLDYADDNHVIHIESMDLPRLTIRHESTDIVNLYCFILDAIIEQLQEDVPENVKNRTQDIKFLAERFRDDYLTHDQSLFDHDSYEETILICKEALDNID